MIIVIVILEAPLIFLFFRMKRLEEELNQTDVHMYI